MAVAAEKNYEEFFTKANVRAYLLKENDRFFLITVLK